MLRIRSYDDACDSLVSILTSASPDRESAAPSSYLPLTISSVLVIVLYSFTAFVNLAAMLEVNGASKVQAAYPGLPQWALPVTTLTASLMVVSSISILLQKKRGYYAFIGAAAAMATAQFFAAGDMEQSILSQLGHCLITLTWPIVFLVITRASGPRSVWAHFD
jgi:hypothetical protein